MLRDACSSTSVDLASKFHSKSKDFVRFWCRNPSNFSAGHLEITRKSMPRALSKQSSHQGPSKVVIFSEFHGFSTSKLKAKIMKIRFENEVEKPIAFGSEFSWILEQFCLRKSAEKRPVEGKLILWKTMFSLDKINDFQLWGPPEIISFATRNANAKRSAPKLEISSIFKVFGLPNRPEKRCGTELVSRRYGCHPHPVASQRALEFLEYLSGYSYD